MTTQPLGTEERREGGSGVVARQLERKCFHSTRLAALCFPPSLHSVRESERGPTSFNEYISSTKTKAKVLVLTNAPSSFLEGSTRRPRPLSFLAFRAASAFGINDATASRLAGIAATRAFFITLQVNRAIRLHYCSEAGARASKESGRRKPSRCLVSLVRRFACSPPRTRSLPVLWYTDATERTEYSVFVSFEDPA